MEIDSSTKKGSRTIPLDLLRGLLIVLMALDHANFLVAQQHTTGEYWGGPVPVYISPLHFLTRFVTHLSAPGFFFLLGLGMVLFVDSRRKKGWTEIEIKVHFLLRGLVLILFQFVINLSQVWSLGNSPPPFWYVGVLCALGAGMILCIPALDLKPGVLLLGAGLFFITLEMLTPNSGMWGRNFDNLAR
ncbi:MAG: heparan-alpha-glucosaminide N-acetyltransferase domain-containing protein, partial [Anaerolineales bacterium]|nr:heparan-alpha-glucosaminide N-acetyltransferase domain-containing protein [Anaerolineales bacterium]